jgi:hypothetical protein
MLDPASSRPSRPGPDDMARCCSPPGPPGRPRASATRTAVSPRNATRWPSGTASVPTTGSSRPSPRSRSTARRWASPLGCPMSMSPSPGELTAAALDRRVRARRRHDGVRLAGRARQRGAHRRRRSAASTGAGSGADRDVGGCAGAVRTLRAVAALAPDATLHTPYGMTEVLPVADIDLASASIEPNSPVRRVRPRSGGVCVGRPVVGAEVRIVELGFDAEHRRVPLRSPGRPARSWCGRRGCRPGTTALAVHRARRSPARRRRPGVAPLGRRRPPRRRRAALGRGSRRARDPHAVDGPVTPVPIEVAVEALDGVGRCAAVGSVPSAASSSWSWSSPPRPAGRGGSGRRPTAG